MRCARKGALSRLQLSEGADDAAKKEAQKWAEMAARMKAQRAAAAGATTPPPPPMEGQPGFIPGTGKASLGVDDLRKLEGKVLPAPSMGELESLMAKAEAFKAKEQAGRKMPLVQPKAIPGGSGPTLGGDKTPARLVGGDAGSMRQAAPFQPGDSKAGAIQEGWSQSQINDMLEAEAEWKQQLAAKKDEERAANALAAGNYFSKVLYLVIFCSKSSRALTFRLLRPQTLRASPSARTSCRRRAFPPPWSLPWCSRSSLRWRL